MNTDNKNALIIHEKIYYNDDVEINYINFKNLWIKDEEKH